MERDGIQLIVTGTMSAAANVFVAGAKTFAEAEAAVMRSGDLESLLYEFVNDNGDRIYIDCQQDYDLDADITIDLDGHEIEQ